MIIHAMHQWKDAAVPQLWPYAVRLANKIINMTPRSKDGKVPLSIFLNSSRSPDLGSLHPFGCPVYVLENALQQGQTLGKWENRNRIGMYLGPSPTHARSVHLVLSIRTGLVSPQFHVRYDDFFESTSWDKFMPRSKWKFKAPILEEKARSTPYLNKITMTRLLRPNSNNNSSSPIYQWMNSKHRVVMRRRKKQPFWLTIHPTTNSTTKRRLGMGHEGKKKDRHWRD